MNRARVRCALQNEKLFFLFTHSKRLGNVNEKRMVFFTSKQKHGNGQMPLCKSKTPNIFIFFFFRNFFCFLFVVYFKSQSL